MIHNGIEYGDMQLIAEAYWVMKNLIDLTNEEMADVFARWNEGKLRSYLIEITSNILRHKDKSGGYLIDKILDAAGQKGTGKWSVINAMELGMPLGLIATAVFERSLSAQKELRHLASKQFLCKHTLPIYNKAELVKEIFSALYASKLVSYAQGFAVLQRASDSFGWNLDLASIARMWRGGCIIRSIFLNDIAAAFEAADKPKHLLLAPYFREEIKSLLPGWKNLVAEAMKEELPVPAFSSALNYFYSLTSDNLPANLVQAQRDYFGAHTFERKDELRGQFFHENWTGHGGETKSGTYNV
jgi:6-phosphogluconate dehydrogenase